LITGDDITGDEQAMMVCDVALFGPGVAPFQ
jgi:hypothetical protein